MSSPTVSTLQNMKIVTSPEEIENIQMCERTFPIERRNYVFKFRELNSLHKFENLCLYKLFLFVLGFLVE